MSNGNSTLEKPYPNANMDNEYIDSYYSRSLGQETPFTTIDSDQETTVCVIGGGIVGSAMTLGLVERGVKKPILIEANRIGWGASGRNGGFMSPSYSLSPLDLIKKVGENHAKELYGLTQDAMRLIKKRLKGVENEILEPTRGYLIISWFDEEKPIREYAEEMTRIFNEPHEFWPRKKVREFFSSDHYYDAYFKSNTLLAHVLKYTRHIAKLAKDLGAEVYEKSPVTKVKKIKSKWHVKTPKGTVVADHVVYCCSAYIGGLHGKLSRATLPVATYALLTEPLGERMHDVIRAPHGASDNRTSCSYYRPLPDGRLLWGGRVSMFHPSQEKLKSIMIKDLLTVYPQLKGINAEVAWGGYMGYAKHKMPQIGKLSEGEWYCQGFGGHGMCSSTAGAEVIAGAIANDDEQYKLFEPFGLDYAGKPFGPVVAQTAYWLFQAQDKMKEWRVN